MTLPAVPGTGQRKAAMGFIMVVVLIDMMSIGLIIPVLPALEDAEMLVIVPD